MSTFKSVCVNLSSKQYDILTEGYNHEISRRGTMLPAFEPVASYDNVDREEKIYKDDGKFEKIFHKRPLDLPAGHILYGVPEKGYASFTNMGPACFNADVMEADGSVVSVPVPVGESVKGFFDGNVALCVIPKHEDRPEDDQKIGRCVFDRMGFSNLCFRDGVEFPVEGAKRGLRFGSVEEAFQFSKIALSGDAEALAKAMTQPSAGKLKIFAGNVKGVPDAWFNAEDGEEPLRCKVMANLQYWAATCKAYHGTLREVMRKVRELGVDPADFSIHEGEDRNYGLGLLPGNVRPVFERNFKPAGGDVMGIHLTAVARKVVELGTHEAYVEWFQANCPIMFSLKPDSVLGARTVSDAGLAPEGRTGSASRLA